MTEPPAASSPSPFSDGDLNRLAAFIYARTGMSFSLTKRYYIERRLSARMQQRQVSDLDAYLQLLATDRQEAQELINAVTVNETYFYREAQQFACLTADLLPRLIRTRQPGDKIRIWSNPCSTGEEPYSIALWLLENWALVDAYHVEIIGSDIDTDALAKAMFGQYSERAVAKLPPRVLQDYFEKLGPREWRLILDIRESVTFMPVNLADPGSMARLGRFDVIFCRNLLIYFDDGSRQAAARHLFESLAPGGYLCLGHTEAMSRISERFTQRRFETATVYQRPGGIDG